MYGRGVHSNWGRAETYFSEAARRGHPNGQRMAATMRDLHLDPAVLDAQLRDNEMRCGVSGGIAIGTACAVRGEFIW